MPKLKRMSGKEAVSILKKFGFREIRQKGSHIILKKTTLGRDWLCYTFAF